MDRARIGRPQAVVGHKLTQRDYQVYLLDNLKRYKYRPRAPIHDMMTGPNDLFRTMSDRTETVLKKLMENVHEYGRANWTWEATTSADMNRTFDEAACATVAGLRGGLTGRGLLDGVISSCACGGFAAAFKGMAEQIFNIQMERANVDGSTAIFGDFITLANVRSIDPNWRGNVWMDVFPDDPQANKLSNRFLAPSSSTITTSATTKA